MGDRYIISVKCECGNTDAGVYYAPTCGFLNHTCSACGLLIDLGAYTGISYEDASNRAEIERLCQTARKDTP